MKQKFKRLLSAILSIVLVIGGLQVSGWTSKATTASAAGYIYFDASETGWTEVYVSFKGWSQPDKMESIGNNIFRYSSPGSDFVIFTKSAEWNWIDSNPNSRTSQFDGVNIGHVYQTTGQKVTINSNEQYVIKDGGVYKPTTPTPGTSYTVYFDASGNSSASWPTGTNDKFYVYGFNDDQTNSGIQEMTQIGTGIYTYTFTTQYQHAIFLRNSAFATSGTNYSNQTVDLTIPWATCSNPIFKLNGGFGENGKKQGDWDNYAGESTTTLFNVSADLVDYFNDKRVGKGLDNPSENEGNATGPDNKPYSNLNQWLSSLPGYASNGVENSGNSNAPVPLYFGDLLHANQAGGNLKWYWQGANVAFGSNDDSSDKTSAQGIVGQHLTDAGQLVMSYTNADDGAVLMPLFEENSYENQANYMKFFKNLQFPFTATTTNGVTKYSFNSKSNTVYYDYDSKKIIRDDTVHVKDVTKKEGYFPFNNPYANKGDATLHVYDYEPDDGDDMWKLNYGFGTKFTIPFTISPTGYDKNGEAITFDFTGDDDVWVYIDGALVLDMGGAHELAQGSINFAEQKVSISTGTSNAKIGNQPTVRGGRAQAEDNGKNNISFKDITVKLEDGTTATLADHIKKEGQVHTLVMYYMERGMWNSNMSITFSFEALPSGLNLTKDVNVASVNPGLQNAVELKDTFDFTIQTSSNGSAYANTNGVSYVKQYDGYSENVNIAADGKVTGLADNISAHTFTKTETTSDSAYELGTYFKITEDTKDNYTTTWTVSEDGKAITNGTGTGTTATFQLGEKDESNPFKNVNYNVNFVNTPTVGSFALEKKWDENQDAPVDGSYNFTVLVDVNGGDNYSKYNLDYTLNDDTETKVAVKGNLSLKVGQKATFSGIPVGATYKIVEIIPDGATYGSNKGNTATGKIEGTEASVVTFTNRTNVIYVEAGTSTKYSNFVDTDVESGKTTFEVVKDDEGNQVITKAVEKEGGTVTTEPTTELTVKTEDGDGKPLRDPEFIASEPDQKYTVSYTGKKDGADVDGILTVYSYSATKKVYVFDYGLPSDIAEANDGKDGLFQSKDEKEAIFYNRFTGTTTNGEENVTTYTTTASIYGDVTSSDEGIQTSIAKEIATGKTGKITPDGGFDGKVIFTPKAFMNQIEEYKYQAQVKADNAKMFKENDPSTGTLVNGTIKVMPASVVYYEDNFNADTSSTDSTVKIVYTGTYSTGDAPTLLQSNGQSEQYGHDAAYSSGATDSAGSSTVLKANGYDTTASFTFTGTGFDIIARTANATAGIVCVVEQNHQPVKVIAVDTYYANGNLYQIPVIHENNFAYGTYTVILYIVANGQKNTVYLDGIRIYNPLNTTGNSAYIDNEEGATIERVSDLILGDGAITEKGVTDSNGNTIKGQTIPTAKAALLAYKENFDSEEGEKLLSPMGTSRVEDVNAGESTIRNSESILTYLNAGPTHEVYLDGDAALAFIAKEAAVDENKDRTIQIEAKLLNPASTNDDGVALSYLNSEGNKIKITQVKSSTAMYYTIPVNECIYLDTDDDGLSTYLVVILGDTTPSGKGCLTFSNVKSNKYTLSNPLGESNFSETLGKFISGEDDDSNNPFVAICSKSVKKSNWSNYGEDQWTVTVKDNTFTNPEKPAFRMYYIKANGRKTQITVYATPVNLDSPNGDVYALRFKAPSATGQFNVQLHTFNGTEESSEYISTIMTVN